MKLKSEESEIDFEDEEELNSAVYKELDGKASPFEVENMFPNTWKQQHLLRTSDQSWISVFKLISRLLEGCVT